MPVALHRAKCCKNGLIIATIWLIFINTNKFAVTLYYEFFIYLYS